MGVFSLSNEKYIIKSENELSRDDKMNFIASQMQVFQNQIDSTRSEFNAKLECVLKAMGEINETVIGRYNRLITAKHIFVLKQSHYYAQQKGALEACAAIREQIDNLKQSSKQQNLLSAYNKGVREFEHWANEQPKQQLGQQVTGDEGKTNNDTGSAETNGKGQ